MPNLAPLVIGGMDKAFGKSLEASERGRDQCGFAAGATQIIGGSRLPQNNRNKQIEEYRKKYSTSDILKITDKTLKTGQYVVENDSLKLTSKKLNPPYSGLVLVLRINKFTSVLLADMMISLSLREYAYVILINESDSKIIVLGTSEQLEKLTIGRDRIFLIKFLDNLGDFSKIGFKYSPVVKLVYDKTDNRAEIEWSILTELTEQDIRELDWSELFDKIESFTTQKYEVGGSANLVDGKIKISEIVDGNIGSVNINHSNPIVFHSHPKTDQHILEPPSIPDLNSALMGFKDGSAAWDVVIAQEGLYVYRPTKFILAHDREVREKLDNLTTGCYKLKPSLCIPVVLNRIRDVGFIIYFLPNKKYFDNLGEEYAMNYWNGIDNVKFLKDMESMKKYTSHDFNKLDWSEIKNVIKLSYGDNLIVADIVDGKVVAAGGAGVRGTDIHNFIGVIPGRYPAMLDIFTQTSNKITGYELQHVTFDSDYVAWNIFLTRDKSIAVRVDKKIKVDVKSEYSVEEVAEMGFKTVMFGKV